jgi:hypothetical protein
MYENLFHDNFQRQMLELADEYFRDMMVANSATPYVHETYEIHLGKARAALVLFAEGDVELASALEWCFHDSNESMLYYLSKFGAEELKADYGLAKDKLRVRFVPYAG